MDMSDWRGLGLTDLSGESPRKEYGLRYRTWSTETNETGYGTALTTPIWTPIKNKFEFPDIDETTIEAIGINSDLEDSVFVNYDPNEPPTTPRPICKARAITKKAELVVDTNPIPIDDSVYYKVAEQIADIRLSLFAQGRWNFYEDKQDNLLFIAYQPYFYPDPNQAYEYPTSTPTQFMDNQNYETSEQPNFGWKHPTRLFLPSLAPEKKRFCKKKQPKPTCEFCRNNGDPTWEDHQCKNEYGEVICPNLASLRCPECGATGKRAHTKRHCPSAERRKRRELELGMLCPSYGNKYGN